MKALSSIQTRVALLLLVFGLAVLGLNARSNARWIRDLQMRGLRADAQAQGTLIAGMMQHCFRNDLRRAAELQMSYASAVPELVEGAVLDEGDVIQFATRLDWMGMKMPDSRLQDMKDVARRVREQMSGVVVNGRGSDEVIAAHPFFTDYDSTHRGVVLLRFDGRSLMERAMAEAWRVSLLQAGELLALCALLWIVMDILITGRVRGLLEQARLHGEGRPLTQTLSGDDELAQVSQAFAAAVDQVRKTEAHLLEAAELEQRRIGAELHDDVCQRITAAQLKCGVLRSLLEREQHAQAAVAGAVTDELAKAAHGTRSFARGLAPMLVERGRLADSLRALASTLSESFSVPCECVCDIPDDALALWVDTHVYRILQELMTNAMKHARPSLVRGGVRVASGRMTLTVENDGVAFGSVVTSPGIGLDMVRQRVRALGGTFSIKAREDGSGCKAVSEVVLGPQHFNDADEEQA